MPLINARLTRTRLQIAAIPIPHWEILHAWRESIENKSIFKQNETSLDSHFIQKILIEILGYSQDLTDRRTLWKNKPIGSGNVDVALGDFSTDNDLVLAPFELKGAKTKDLDAIMPGRHKSPVQQAWEYAMDAPGAQWVLVSNYLEIRLYAVGYGRQHYEHWDLARLTEPLEYARLQWLLHAKQLIGGATRNILDQSAQLEQEITNKLYSDYQQLREQLLQDLPVTNPHVSALDLIRHSQTILDRILFIAFAEDRGLLPDKTIAHAFHQHNPYAPQPIWENFKGLFRAIDSGNAALKIPAYNGGLFTPDAGLEGLVVSDKLCAGFKRLADYDFATEVSVTILGHIFEQSITDIETLQAAARGEIVSGVSKRKQHGVVYTPDYITSFIVEHTLGKHLQIQFTDLWTQTAPQRKAGNWKKPEHEIAFWRAYQQILRNTRVLDPACGSGAFLVAAFDRLYEEYNRVNTILADLAGGSYGVFDLDKEILNRNLYGVDLNEESVEITKLSLWLKTAKRGKVLNDLHDTIQVGNSLIEDATYTDKPFVWAQFAAIARTRTTADLFNGNANGSSQHLASESRVGNEDLGFDVIVGNPPYVRQELLSPIKPYLQQHYRVYNGTIDLYAYFFELGLNLLKPGGRLGFISSSTFFKTGSGETLRRLLLEHTCLETVVDFGDLQIFGGVTTYPAILAMQKLAPSPDQQLNMLVLGQTLPADLSKYFTAHATTMLQASLDIAAWRLENAALTALRRKITQGKPTLKQIYGSPLYGIKTGLNEAFVVDQATRDALIQANPRSAEVLKPFLEGKDLKKWHTEGRDLSLIFIPKGWTKQQSSVDDETTAWEWLATNYPTIAKHLQPFANTARKRCDKGDFWWELRACSYYEEFEQRKVTYAHFQSYPLFSVTKAGIYCNCKAYIAPAIGFCELGLLNSKVMWFIFSGMATMKRGSFFEASTQTINKLPIPKIPIAKQQIIATLAEQCQTIAENRYAKQQAVRRRIPDLAAPGITVKLSTKLHDWWLLDFPTFRQEVKKCCKQDIPLAERNAWEQWLAQERTAINAMTTQLTTLEQQLNTCVYELFDLTAEEITLIESTIT